MLALLNNQNFAALQFLKNLTDFQEQYVQTRQHLRSLSLGDDDEGTKPVKKRRFQTCKLLEFTAFGDSSVTDHIWAHQHPQTLARQAAGTYCTGVLTGSGNGKKVLIKSSNQQLPQQHQEIKVLQELAGTYGVPELLGKSGDHLVLSHNGAVPHHGLLKQDHIKDIQRIIDAMHAKGWTLEYITRQNIWSDAESVMLYNFENAVPTREARQLMTIHDFVQACDIGRIPCSGYTSSITSNSQLGVESETVAPSSSLESASNQDAETIDGDDNSFFEPSILVNVDSTSTKLAEINKNFLTECCRKPEAKRNRAYVINQKETVTNSVSGAAPKIQAIETFGSITRILTDGAVAGQPANASLSSTTYSVIIQRERDFAAFTGVRYSNCLKIWARKSKTKQFNILSELWTRTHDDLYPTMGPGLSWDSGIPYRDTRGYGTASSNICFFLASVHKKYNASHSCRPTKLQTFVDIGSGVCNMVLKMSVLMHDFRMCFGIEIVPFRAKFAQSACQSFASNAAAACVPFCKIIQAETGDVCANRHSQEALESAGLVWINNQIFHEEDNMKMFELLNALVPVGCVIVTFQPLLKTKRTDPQVLVNTTPCDFTVHSPEEVANACSWGYGSGNKRVFIIQRTSRLYHNKKYFQ
jgi:hypothetical protein